MCVGSVTNLGLRRGSRYRVDPHLRISPELPLTCGDITIEATGDMVLMQPKCLGDYTLTKRFSAGRRVFKHKSHERYLLVEAGHVPWYVKESVDSEEAYYMHSGCAPSMCPADPRARTREDTGQVSWGYWDGDGRNWTYTGGITIKCSVHTY